MAIASTEFSHAAETQAQALGMSGAKRIFVNHPIQDATSEEMRVKADTALNEVIDALSAGNEDNNA